MTKQDISDTLNEAVKRSGTQSALAKKAGIQKLKSGSTKAL